MVVQRNVAVLQKKTKELTFQFILKMHKKTRKTTSNKPD